MKKKSRKIYFVREFLEEQVFEMQTQFKTERANLPSLCLMPSVAFYEHTKPNVPILKRVIQLAKEALEYLEKNNSDSMKVRRILHKRLSID
jgi:hypothetical protein